MSTTEEYALYSYVSHYGKRLEQEHISQDLAIQYLSNMLTKDQDIKILKIMFLRFMR